MSIRLLSSDNEEFVVERAIAERSVLIKNMLEGKRLQRRKKIKLSFSLFTIIMELRDQSDLCLLF